MTALGTDGEFHKTWDAAFNGVLVKPIDYETVAAQLEHVFCVRGRLRRSQQ